MAFSAARVRVSGKFFRIGDTKWYAKGFCYGPFAPNGAGEFFPEPAQALEDLAHMRRLGATCLRTYFPPPDWLLDAAQENGLKLLAEVPWDKHRCFLEDWTAQQQARRAVEAAARRMGRHDGLFAVSVANEIPNDIVRFYGTRRISAFLDELMDRVHQAAPDCLVTYANFPTTEFLQPSQQDFCCFNVYLDDAGAFGRYIDRLQHLAGGSPLVIGEYGVDSTAHGETCQAQRLVDFTELSFRRGVAGALAFSYTDDWFTGGRQIDQWTFGVTSRQRQEKPAAVGLSRTWRAASRRRAAADLPRVSVVVCSYNGAATLEECLQSLMSLDYPDYEVLLVDDGSQDDTLQIAAQYPQVSYIRQANQGLSVARNVGLRSATGEVVAYTDSDCVADEDWLLYLIQAMQQQGVDGIGGPNLTPASDNATAQCVALSPGNPSHVMFDDRLAEHLPGCNMAFRRQALLAVGGFDPQFRQAGDDVDICWRMLAAGHRLGYAPGAMVWHHRRCTVRAYYRQQKGYGRAEAMLAFKHPQRFVGSGLLRFDGVIYGDGKAGLPLLPPKVYHGRFGSALFQTIYQAREFRFDARATSLEWHCLSALFLLLSTMAPPLGLLSLGMWLLTVQSVVATVEASALPSQVFIRSRLLIYWLHLMQPVVRGLHRNGYTLRNKRLPQALLKNDLQKCTAKRISSNAREFYWSTSNGKGRHELLDVLEVAAKRDGWPGDYYGGWAYWDLQLMADVWHHVSIHTATEELGWPKRFTRARWVVETTRVARAATTVVLAWSVVALFTHATWGLIVALATSCLLLGVIVRSRRRCLTAVGKLIQRAAEVSGLASPEATDSAPSRPRRPTRAATKVHSPGAPVTVQHGPFARPELDYGQRAAATKRSGAETVHRNKT